MKNRIFFLLLVPILFISGVYAVPNSLNVNVQTTDGTGTIVTGTYNFTFNISTASDCSAPIYNKTLQLTTDSRGIINMTLDNIAFTPTSTYYLCYYRNNILKSNSIIASALYSLYAQNSSWAGLTGAASVPNDFSVDTNVLYVNTSSNKVGIGTTNPSYLLTLYNDSGTLYQYFNSGTLDAYFVLANASGQGSSIAQSGDLTLRVDDGDLILNTRKSGGKMMFTFGTPDAAKMTLTNLGKLGIGTSTPEQMLSLNLSSGDVGLLLQSGTKKTYFALANATGDFSALANIGDTVIRDDDSNIVITARNNVGNITFGTKVAEKARMVITNGGNVGIGTTNPSSTLEVNGSSTVNNQLLNYPLYLHEISTLYPINATFSVNKTSDNEQAAIGAIGSIFGISSDGYGIAGASESGTGVLGQSNLSIGGLFSTLNSTSYAIYSNGDIYITSKLIIAPSIQITCSATTEGAIYYNTSTKTHYGCNSSNWNALY